MNNHKIHKLLYLQIQGINTLQIPDQRDYQIVRYARNQLAVYLISIRLEHPISVNQWVQWLTKPVGTWLDASYEELFNLDEPIYDLRMKDISYASFCFLRRFDPMEDYQTLPVLRVRDHCKKHCSEEGYVRFRSILTNPKYAVLGSEGYEQLISNEKDLIIREQLMKCYERVDDWKKYRKCPRCGWTLHFKGGKWQCGKYNICSKVSDKGFLYPKSFRYTEAESVYRLTPGIHCSVLVPGIPEQRIYNKIRKRKYYAELYPNFDHDGDIRVVLKNCTVVFDVKSYLNPHGLAREIEEKQYKGEAPIIVVPSEYSVEGGPLYLVKLKNRLKKSRKDVRIISERSIIRCLKEKEKNEQIKCI